MLQDLQAPHCHPRPEHQMKGAADSELGTHLAGRRRSNGVLVDPRPRPGADVAVLAGRDQALLLEHQGRQPGHSKITVSRLMHSVLPLVSDLLHDDRLEHRGLVQSWTARPA